jgi:pyruvate/2-oxoglutarate dehydrogenase complex dihydrolipoamide dehydrogenase (E3) component
MKTSPDLDCHYDLIVVGSGPAGHYAAIAAGRLGKTVALVSPEDEAAAWADELRDRGVDALFGRLSFISGHEIRLESGETTRRYRTGRVLIASATAVAAQQMAA